jgi:hypothetical protein
VKARRYYVGKNLSRVAAYRAASRKSKKDFRGMKYNKRTGYASVV